MSHFKLLNVIDCNYQTIVPVPTMLSCIQHPTGCGVLVGYRTASTVLMLVTLRGPWMHSLVYGYGLGLPACSYYRKTRFSSRELCFL